jgi:hypothetical protein
MKFSGFLKLQFFICLELCFFATLKAANCITAQGLRRPESIRDDAILMQQVTKKFFKK